MVLTSVARQAVGWRALAQVLAPCCCCGCGLAGVDLCASCAAPLHRGARRADPDPRPHGLPPVFAAAPYDGALRAAVNELKERGRTGLLRPLGAGLSASVAAAILSGPPGALPPVTWLVPVPSSPDAARGRDVAATALLAAAAAARLRRLGLTVRCWHGLRPRRRRADQTGLDAARRAANLAGAMRARRPPSGPGATAVVVVVDDVVTTGATLLEASRALQAAGTPVRGCAVVAATARHAPAATRSAVPDPGPGLPH